MSTWKQIAAVALGALVLVPFTTAATASVKRPRPSEVVDAVSAFAPNPFQACNDYASPERTYSSRRAVVHYVVLGIDAPPLNDDDADGVPDYVGRVGEAADRALAYYERRGFHVPVADEGGPDSRPDVYVSRCSPGTLGVAFPAARALGGAFAVVSNNLDPSPERSFASVSGTVAHELFHLVQFSYFARAAEPEIPAWILEGTAAALEGRAAPALDDLVSGIQVRRWLSATHQSITTQSYGAQLLWRRLDTEQPGFLPALFRRLAARPVAGEGQLAVAATYGRVAGRPFPQAFHRFAVSVTAERGEAIEPVFVLPPGARRHARVAPLAVHYIDPRLRRSSSSSLSVSFPRGRGAVAATLTYRLDDVVAGRPPRLGRIAGRSADGGRTLTFAVPARLRADARLSGALLVVSNGGERAVDYVVSSR